MQQARSTPFSSRKRSRRSPATRGRPSRPRATVVVDHRQHFRLDHLPRLDVDVDVENGACAAVDDRCIDQAACSITAAARVGAGVLELARAEELRMDFVAVDGLEPALAEVLLGGRWSADRTRAGRARRGGRGAGGRCAGRCRALRYSGSTATERISAANWYASAPPQPTIFSPSRATTNVFQ